MNRRKFLANSAIASTVPLTSISSSNTNFNLFNSDKEIYELRTYHIKFRGSQQKLKDYLTNNYGPELKKNGANHVQLFNEYGMEEPAKLWMLISYPDANTYISCQSIIEQPNFLASSASYHNTTPEETIYSRFESSLLLAFDGMPKMDTSSDGSLFELRIYEGFSEDAVRRKIKMFNIEEIDLFLKIGLKPVFFGDMISGPFRPSLVYMLQFSNMEQRDSLWNEFGKHPEWQAMRIKKEYANTVSNIRKIFLVQAI